MALYPSEEEKSFSVPTSRQIGVGNTLVRSRSVLIFFPWSALVERGQRRYLVLSLCPMDLACEIKMLSSCSAARRGIIAPPILSPSLLSSVSTFSIFFSCLYPLLSSWQQSLFRTSQDFFVVDPACISSRTTYGNWPKSGRERARNSIRHECVGSKVAKSCGFYSG